MPGGRIPGPYGKGKFSGGVLKSGPLNSPAGPQLKDPHLTPGPMGTNKDLAATAAKPAKKMPDPDEEELKLLVSVYGIVKNKKATQSYVYWKKKKKHYRVKEYVADRNAFFGSAKAYTDFRDVARKELEADNGKLRRYIEPPLKKRKSLKDWKKAQDVFYAWVRKAYKKKLGDKIDIPKLIKSQMSEKLKKALKQVKLDYGKSFQAGGFNPRPMKLGGYRLGTISDHAVGTAIDIESAKNPHIPTKTWKSILSFTGKSLDHAKRKSLWKTTPKKLHDGIKEINDEFVSKLAKAIKDVETESKKSAEEAAKKGAEAKTPAAQPKAKAAAAKIDPLEAAVKKDKDLEEIGLKFLKKWKKGFFNLPWELVKELHEEDFLWGATFSHPDLHHFEL
jgi:hypothetical protein